MERVKRIHWKIKGPYDAARFIMYHLGAGLDRTTLGNLYLGAIGKKEYVELITSLKGVIENGRLDDLGLFCGNTPEDKNTLEIPAAPKLDDIQVPEVDLERIPEDINDIKAKVFSIKVNKRIRKKIEEILRRSKEFIDEDGMPRKDEKGFWEVYQDAVRALREIIYENKRNIIKSLVNILDERVERLKGVKIYTGPTEVEVLYTKKRRTRKKVIYEFGIKVGEYINGWKEKIYHLKVEIPKEFLYL